MPLQATSGAASYDAFGGGAAAVPQYIEDVFSTYLYSGNDTSGTSIVNNIDLSTKGGLVWIKNRTDIYNHVLTDTVRGSNFQLASNTTDGQTTSAFRVSAFNTNGFSLGASPYVNGTPDTYVSWTFREQPKFFDIVTYTGNGSNMTISHNLGSAPACIFVKRTNTTGNWSVYHISLGNTKYLRLNTTDAEITDSTAWNNTTPTSTTFTVGTNLTGSGDTYVAYLFAHNAGGFGLTGTDNVISCGSYTTNASAVGSATLGYEPQFLMVKRATGVGEWYIVDNMRGWGMTQAPTLRPNSSGIEDATGFGGSLIPTATGFEDNGAIATSSTLIYIAIRRGPMKVPTDATKVFNTITYTGTSGSRTVTGVGFPPDLVLSRGRTNETNQNWFDRLRGPKNYIRSTNTDAEATDTGTSLIGFDAMDGYRVGTDQVTAAINFSPRTYAPWNFRRAPSFFDEVCYTGTGTGTTVTHNLGVTPELMIIKNRSNAANWAVWQKDISPSTAILFLNNTATQSTGYVGSVTATTFAFLSPNVITSANGDAYVAYLFATCAGVSKVGSYTGNGTTQTIDCGFTGGARFVLIRRTDSTGDWYVWDSARGIVSGNDPYLLLNSTAAEVTNTDYIDTYSAGFEISSTAPSAINASGGTFIFLAIA